MTDKPTTPTPRTDAAELTTDIYYRWLRLMAKCPDLPNDTQTSEGLPGWLNKCAERMEALERENAVLRESLHTREQGGEWVSRTDHEDALGELRRERDQLDDERLSWKNEAEKRGEAIAELRRDKERLDWLLTQDPPAEVIIDYAYDPAFDAKIIVDTRAAIDAAMKEDTQP